MRFSKDTSPELKNIASELINRKPEFKDLKESGAKILFIWREKPRMDDDARPVAARVAKLSPRWRDVLSRDFEIEVCETIWRKLDQKWRRRIIEHELRHIALSRQEEDETRFEVDKEGRLKVEIVPHDLVIRTFVGEVKAHGFDIGDIEAVRFIYEAYKRVKAGKLATYEVPEILRPETEDEVPAESAESEAA